MQFKTKTKSKTPQTNKKTQGNILLEKRKMTRNGSQVSVGGTGAENQDGICRSYRKSTHFLQYEPQTNIIKDAGKTSLFNYLIVIPERPSLIFFQNIPDITCTIQAVGEKL